MKWQILIRSILILSSALLIEINHVRADNTEQKTVSNCLKRIQLLVIGKPLSWLSRRTFIGLWADDLSKISFISSELLLIKQKVLENKPPILELEAYFKSTVENLKNLHALKHKVGHSFDLRLAQNFIAPLSTLIDKSFDLLETILIFWAPVAKYQSPDLFHKSLLEYFEQIPNDHSELEKFAGRTEFQKNFESIFLAPHYFADLFREFPSKVLSLAFASIGRLEELGLDYESADIYFYKFFSARGLADKANLFSYRPFEKLEVKRQTETGTSQSYDKKEASIRKPLSKRTSLTPKTKTELVRHEPLTPTIPHIPTTVVLSEDAKDTLKYLSYTSSLVSGLRRFREWQKLIETRGLYNLSQTPEGRRFRIHELHGEYKTDETRLPSGQIVNEKVFSLTISRLYRADFIEVPRTDGKKEIYVRAIHRHQYKFGRRLN